MVGVFFTDPIPISPHPALSAIPRVAWGVTQERPDKHSLITPPSVKPRTEKEWWSILARRCARMDELISLNAPDILIENEKRLILDAKIALSIVRRPPPGVVKPS